MSKICICSTPIRDIPATVPPFSAMAIIQSLQKNGENPDFYHLDYFRPNQEEIFEYFEKNQYEYVLISTIVSTSYQVTKELSEIIKKINPNTIIILGGHVVASANVILNKCPIDYCVIGDGEIIINNLLDSLKKGNNNDISLNNIPGISFIDSKGKFRFTGWGETLGAEEIESADFSILEKIGCLDYYFPTDNAWLDLSYRQNDPNSNFPLSKNSINVLDVMNMKSSSVISSRGCVAKCTFCHRLEKGFKARPSDKVIEHIKYLKDRYNIGIIDFQDENFGSNKKITDDLVKALGELGLLWRVGGVRSRTIDRETLDYWKANGCERVSYGIESGSPRMLKVMQKNISQEQNYNGIKWAYEAGITVNWIKLVVGMPGEDDTTIKESIDFLIKCMPYYADVFRKKPNLESSIYYAQALPGTPLYEYLRENRFIKNNIDSEEEYLYKISNIDASSTEHFVNYTTQPMLKVMSWKYWINWTLYRYHAKNNLGISLSNPILVYKFLSIKLINGIKKITNIDIQSKNVNKKNSDNPYDNINLNNFPMLLIPWNKFTYPFILLPLAWKKSSNILEFFRLLIEHLSWSLNIFWKNSLPEESLRKVVNIADNDDTVLLRQGR